MSELISTPCPHCGEDVHIPSSVQEVQCARCGRRFERSFHSRNAEKSITVLEPTWRSSPPRNISRWIGATILLGVIVFGVTLSFRTSAVDEESGIVPEGEQLRWDPLSPILVVPDDDGGDKLFAGRYRIFQGSHSTLHAGVFDARTLERVWGSESLGSYEADDAFKYSHVARVEDTLVITDAAATAQLRSLDGRELGRLVLPERAVSLCPVPRDNRVWIEAMSGQYYEIDLENVALKRGEPPSICGASMAIDLPAGCGPMDGTGFVASAQCSRVDDTLRADDMVSERVLRRERYAVVIGVRASGKHLPMVAGFLSEDGTQLWSRVVSMLDEEMVASGVPELVDLVDGRLVVQYPLEQGGARLTSIDAGTGAILWDEAVPRSGDGEPARAMQITSTRIYLPHWMWLEVFNGTDGRHLATLGRW